MRNRHLALPIIVLAAAVLAAGCGGDDDDRSDASRDAKTATTETTESEVGTTETTETTTTATTAEDEDDREFEIEVEDGVVTGGPQSLRVRRGEAVKLRIRSDAPDEVHLHGIDIETAVGPDERGELEFTPKDQGSYELELHESGLVLGAVVVS